MIQVQIDKLAAKLDLAVRKNAGLVEPTPKPKRVRFKTDRVEREKRAKLLEVFTGPIGSDIDKA